jgi:hypothetical protein
MKLSWNSLKVSIAGARLSHLVQKDKIWDHGSMTEQVKNVFFQVEKARHKKDAETVKKYLTLNGFEKLKAEIDGFENARSFVKNSVLTEIFITQVARSKKHRPDSFKALVKGKRKTEEDLIPIGVGNYGIENFSEEWFFVRQGEWWLLDGIKN